MAVRDLQSAAHYQIDLQEEQIKFQSSRKEQEMQNHAGKSVLGRAIGNAYSVNNPHQKSGN